MGRPGAADERVLAAAEAVLRTHRVVQTQRRLAELVSHALAKEDPPASVSPERLRRLLAAAPFCRLDYRTRNGPPGKVLNACPICGGGLRRLKNQTLFGGEVTLTLRCRRCPYWTEKKKRIPTLYVFHYATGARPAGPAADAPPSPAPG